jgi:hypothetical protein
VQCGLQPDDFKPMPTIGKGVEEIRIRDDSGIHSMIEQAANLRARAELMQQIAAMVKKNRWTQTERNGAESPSLE